MVFGNCGILGEMGEGKAYVEMSGIDADTSQDIHDVSYLLKYFIVWNLNKICQLITIFFYSSLL